MKICRVCGIEGPCDGFAKGRRLCKSCNREKARRWREENHERSIANSRKWHSENKERAAVYDRKRYEENKKDHMARVRRWQADNQAKVHLYGIKWRANNQDIARLNRAAWRAANPEKCKAHSAVAKAGLRRGPCEVCGAAKVDGHHSDYSKPLSVHWLCRTHHSELHRLQR